MKPSELIKRLQELPPDTEVFVWCDDRYPIDDDHPLDDTWLQEHKFIDINLGDL